MLKTILDIYALPAIVLFAITYATPWLLSLRIVVIRAGQQVQVTPWVLVMLLFCVIFVGAYEGERV